MFISLSSALGFVPYRILLLQKTIQPHGIYQLHNFRQIVELNTTSQNYHVDCCSLECPIGYTSGLRRRENTAALRKFMMVVPSTPPVVSERRREGVCVAFGFGEVEN